MLLRSSYYSGLTSPSVCTPFSAAANQTIDQVKIFGGYTRWHVDLPPPASEFPSRMVLTTVDTAFMNSTGSLPGALAHIVFSKVHFGFPRIEHEFLPKPAPACVLDCIEAKRHLS